MQQIVEQMNAYASHAQLAALEGAVATSVAGVWFYRSSEPHTRQPMLYEPGILIMGQGLKHIYLGEHKMSYGPGDYVVLGVPLPLECEALLQDGDPILGLKINITPEQLSSTVRYLERQEPSALQTTGDPLGMQCNNLSSELSDAFLRLLKVMQQPDEAAFIGPDIVKEIIYRVLKGPNGHILYDRANREDGNYARIARVLDTLHASYAEPLTVESLAEQAHMSVPAFHRAFKQVTTQAPLQYLKKVRLTKARELLLLQGYRAADAARQVGYNSPSQFSREFKRLFNFSPKDSLSQA